MSFDRHGACLSVNDEGLRMMNYRKYDIIGSPFIDIWAEESRQEVEKAIRTVLGGEQTFFKAKRSDGVNTTWWSVKLIPVKVEEDAEQTGFISFSTNITEDRRKSEKIWPLSQSEEKYRLYQNIFDSMEDIVHITDSEFNTQFVNKACETAFGPVRDQKCYQYLHGMDRPCRWCGNKEVFSGKSYRTANFFKKAGKYFDSYQSPLVNDDGSISALVILRDMSEKKKLEDNLIKTLEQRNILIREMHHRVKNNLTLLQSLLELQERRLADDSAKSSLMDTQSRIRTMSLVHERLYRSEDLKNVDAGEYLSTLAGKVFHTFNTRRDDISLRLDIAKAEMDIDTLVPLGLVINELLTNALKYAFPGDTRGEIQISLSKTEDSFEVMVRDSGAGLPGGLDVEKSDTLGMKIIRALISQIDGTLRIESDKGTSFHITFRDRKAV